MHTLNNKNSAMYKKKWILLQNKIRDKISILSSFSLVVVINTEISTYQACCERWSTEALIHWGDNEQN